MRKYVIAWTFMRHIHRQREYRILQKIFMVEATIPNQKNFVQYYMNNDPDVRALFDRGFNRKMEAITEIQAEPTVTAERSTDHCEVCDKEAHPGCPHPKNGYCAAAKLQAEADAVEFKMKK